VVAARAGATALVVGCVAAGCSRHPIAFLDSFLAMDSMVQTTIVCASDDSAQAGFAAVRREVARLESILSDYRSDSNVGQLNRRLTDVLAPETRTLLERAQQVCRESGGVFDVSIRPVKRLWGFGSDLQPRVPEAAEIAAALAHVGCDVYTITPDGRLEWNDPEAEIDLGGIAQGFVAGCVADTLRSMGLHRFLIDISGDLVASGTRAGGGPWRVGIQHPRRPDSLVARLSLDVASITTSGDYEQFFERDGRRYHHLIDPRTGAPARDVVSASVLSADPVAADCYTKVVFVLGRDRGLQFLNARPDLRGIVIGATDGAHLDVRTSDDLAIERR
jgi:thiamine biosynthesis lipoprotein